jgi:hypothetical protein
MRTALILTASLLAAPVGARAECHSAPECLAQLRLPRIGWQAAAVMGAVAAPVVLLGAVVSAASGQREKPAPVGVVTRTEGGRPKASLALVPPMPDPYAHAASGNTRPSGAFKFNDVGTNVALAVGGAAILTSIIAGIAGNKRH